MESVASRISANHVSHKNNANASLKVTNRGNSASMNLSKSTHNIPSSMSGVSSLFPSDSLLGFIEKTSENTLECRVNSARYTLKSVFSTYESVFVSTDSKASKVELAKMIRLPSS